MQKKKPAKKTPAKKKRFRQLRTIKRGWTQPDKEMKRRIIGGVLGGIADASTVPKEMAALEKIGADKLHKMFTDILTKRRDQRFAYVNRTATKYALDAAGVTGRKLRREIHSITKDAMETISASRDPESMEYAVSVAHAEKELYKLDAMLGVKVHLFKYRYMAITRFMNKELKKYNIP